MTLYFVRHGETEWNVKKKIQGKTDIPLNEKGVEQARCLADQLKKEHLNIGRVYTSPQLRALQTAQIAAEALGAECITLNGLREMDMGDWEGLDWKTIEENYGEIYYHWDSHRRYTKTPHGESYHEVLERTLQTLSELLEFEAQDALVVSHSAVLMALRCYLAELPFSEMVKRFKTQNAQVVEIQSADIKAAKDRFIAGK